MNKGVIEAKRRIQECLDTQSESLDLSWCDLSTLEDIPELLQCTHIKELNLSGNLLDDISVLKDLGQLTSLNLSHNPLDDISVLKDLGQLTSLNLSHNPLDDISVLKDLGQLTSLNLSHNPLKDISILKDLGQLTSLDLSWNELTNINVLKDLGQLTSLNLSHNPLKDISILKDLGQLTSLNLSHTPLKDISILKDLGQLTSLDLSWNELTDISILKDLGQLTSLMLSGNQLDNISVLKGLGQLITLDLSGNQLTDISVLKDLGQLITLDLSGNQLTDISVLKDLGQLITLTLSGNRLEDISILKGLGELTTLDLRNNQLTDISVLKDLRQLTKLHLDGNQLEDISVLKDLGQLISLTLSGNRLEDISVLKGLGELTTLDLRNNQLTDISVLKDLRQLTILHLDGNRLEDISVLKGLRELIVLDLRNNQLTEISALQKLKQLKFLWLENNQITFVPEFIFHLLNWKRIINRILKGNPIVNPPREKIKQGREAVLEWFKANKVGFKEIKVLLVGEHNAGKTSLLKVLKQDEFDENEPQTDGINIVDIDFEKNQPRTFAKQKKLHGVKARFWDFGGQEILSSTHKLFFTSRSLYILLFNAREDSNIEKKVRDKVREIKAGGGDSPILVVANQIDVNPGFEFVNTHALQKEFPQIKSFLKVSCATRENIESLKDALETLIPDAGFLNSEISKMELDLKDKILELTQNENFLDERQFTRISKKVGLLTKEARTNAIDFLDKVGLALYFSKIKMSRFYVLDPNWVTTALYRIITSKKAVEQKGMVHLLDLDYILNEEREKQGKDYHPFTNKDFKYECDDERTFLSQILVVYKLAFERNKNEFILPNLLKGNPKDSLLEAFEKTDTLQLIYDYGKMPANIMSEIIVDFSSDSSRFNMEDCWKTGCYVVKNDCEALIRKYNDRIQIKVKGEDKRARRDLMIYVTAVIEIINKDLPKPPLKLIPLPDIKNGEVQYQKLTNRLAKGKNTYYYHEDLEDEKAFDIGLLLDGIPTQSEIDKIMNRLDNKLDVVIDNTNKIKSELQEHLTKICKQNQQIQDKIAPAVAAITDKTIQEEICQEMLQLISNAFTLHQADMDEKLKAVYQQIQNTDIVSSKLELSIPLLNVFGVNYKTEIDLKQWKKQMYEKYKLPLFNLFGYVG